MYISGLHYSGQFLYFSEIMPGRRNHALAGRGRQRTAHPVGRPSTRSVTARRLALQQRNAVVQQPNPGAQPAAIVQQPNPGAQPAAIVQQPNPGAQPAAIVQQPNPGARQPAAIVQQPNPGAQQPAVIVQQPIPGAQQPAAIVQQPTQGAPNDIISISKEELSVLLEKASTAGARKAMEGMPPSGALHAKDTTQGVDAVRSLTQDLLQGENIDINIDAATPRPPPPKFNMTLALDLHVPSTLRAKILNNEFVYLSDLLVKDRDRVSTSVQLSSTGQLVLQSHPKKIVNIEQWNEAFNIFCVIYSKKYTASYAGLLKHATNVRHLHSKGGDWQAYDQQYRLYVQSGGCNWGDYNAEIYNNAMVGANFRGQQPKTNFKNQYPSKPGQSRYSDREKYPIGYCWQFIDGKECKCDKSKPNARKHICPRCSQRHALKYCPRSDKSKQTAQSQ